MLLLIFVFTYPVSVLQNIRFFGVCLTNDGDEGKMSDKEYRKVKLSQLKILEFIGMWYVSYFKLIACV